MEEADYERVRDIVSAIPSGEVLSYGDIATLAGLPSPRLVGRVLAEDGQDIPWHRVLRSTGRPAEHLARRQLALLRSEGVLAEDGRVPMARYRSAMS